MAGFFAARPSRDLLTAKRGPQLGPRCNPKRTDLAAGDQSLFEQIERAALADADFGADCGGAPNEIATDAWMRLGVGARASQLLMTLRLRHGSLRTAGFAREGWRFKNLLSKFAAQVAIYFRRIL
jgi:hypothetical protein